MKLTIHFIDKIGPRELTNVCAWGKRDGFLEVTTVEEGETERVKREYTFNLSTIRYYVESFSTVKQPVK